MDDLLENLTDFLEYLSQVPNKEMSEDEIQEALVAAEELNYPTEEEMWQAWYEMTVEEIHDL